MLNIIGKTFGQYRILEKIGAGGMATVYKAYQPGMDRYVAVKILPPQLSDDEQFARRFQREAHAIARLEHAHILPVFDYGESEGIAYIVMRYIPAGTLKEYLAQGRLPLDEVARIISQVGGALDYAHRQGVIHRDVKPGNVLMGEEGNTYLTDFGLARMMESSQQLTGSGVGVGTPAYMAPEQGMGAKVDQRSDIYSLGIVLYEMVTGHVPFEAETPMAVVLKHISEPLPLPRAIRPDIPEPIELVILKALAKETAHRYQSAADLVEALNTALRKSALPEEKPIPAPAPVPVIESIPAPLESPPAPRRKAAWLKLALAAIALILLTTLGFLLFNQFATKRASLPATATLIPTRRAAAMPTLPPAPASQAKPEANSSVTETKGKRVNYCANQPSMQICYEDFDRGEVIQVTTDLHFEGQTGLIYWSPDGNRFVFSGAERAAGPEKLYTINADGTEFKQITFGETYDHQAAWSPDGEWIVFASSSNMRLIRPDGSESHIILPAPESCGWNAMAWSPDSRKIASMKICGGGLAAEVWTVKADGTEQTKLHTIAPNVFGGITYWSPDGRQIVASYEINKAWQHVLIGLDDGTVKEIDWQPSNWDAAFWPQWGRQQPPPPGVLWLDGETGYASIPFADSLRLTQALTIESWVHLAPRKSKICDEKTAGYCNFMPLIAQSNQSSSIGNYLLAVDQGKPLFGFEPVSIGDILYRTETLVSEGWHHLAVVHTFGQAARTQLYLDGQPIAGNWDPKRQPNEGAYPQAKTAFLIGFMTSGEDTYFEGLLDELRIWNLARTPAEIRATMNTELIGSEPGLVGYWKFNEPESATIATDSSPYGNHAYLLGSAQIQPADSPAQP